MPVQVVQRCGGHPCPASGCAPTSVRQTLRAPGRPLDPVPRRLLERRFGTDLDTVRVHTDSAAAESARDVHAQAYTVGEHIAFAPGRYEPHSAGGLRLLTHELTHVLQQRAGGAALQSLDEALVVGDHDDPLEQEAERVAKDATGDSPLATAGRACRAFDGPAVLEQIMRRQRTAVARLPVPGVALNTLLALPVLQRQLDSGVPDTGAGDAGVSLPGGVPPTAEELEDRRLNGTPPADLVDEDIGPALELAQRQGDQPRYNAILDQMRQRDDTQLGIGMGLPLAMPRGVGGTAMVTPDVAVAMIENMLAGRPPFRPELGVGGSSWFTTAGEPYTGVGAGSTVPVQAELINTQNAVRFEQPTLERLFFEEAARARPEVEAQVRERFRLRTGRDAPETLSRALADRVTRQLRQLAESRMWERVGALVRASPTQVGKVILPGGTPTPTGPPVFSRTPGEFTVIGDAAKIRLRGGPMPLVRAIEAAGAGERVAPLEASAAELARTMRLAGSVRTVLRVGGKILIVVAVALDIYEIIVAEDHLEATVVSLAGWGGAFAGAAAFSALWTPLDVAGPWAWAAHGVGILISGAVGYWVGAGTTRYVYRLVVQSRGQIQETL